MSYKTKILLILTSLRKNLFPTNEETYEMIKSLKQPGMWGNFLIKIYFPSINLKEDKKATLSRMLNRIVLIAGISGILCLCSLFLDLHFLEGIFLIFCMSSIFPYIAYIFANKKLSMDSRN